MRWVLCRPRDENGDLVRVSDDVPGWAAKYLDSKGHWSFKSGESYGDAFRRAKESQGFSEEEREAAWRSWKQDNPGFGLGGEVWLKH